MNILNQRSKIAVIGYGVEGKAMLKWLVSHKYADLTVCDRQVRLSEKLPDGVSARLGGQYLDGLSEFDVIFRSPGVPHHDPAVVAARVCGTHVTSPTQFFLEHCPCTVIGVTGTKGKGTTSTLIYEILKAGVATKKKGYRAACTAVAGAGGLVGRGAGTWTGVSAGAGNKAGARGGKVYLGGNIGNPPIEFLDRVRGNDVVVLELSCFQLGDLRKSPAVAVFLNTTIDHLDYYPDVDEYMHAKELILTNQDGDDLAILNKDYEYVKHYTPLVKGRLAYVSPRGGRVEYGAWVEDGWIIYARSAGERVRSAGGCVGKPERVVRVADVALIGSHNLENVCPAVVVGREFGVAVRDIARVVKKFKGLPHRLEFVRKIGGGARGVATAREAAATRGAGARGVATAREAAAARGAATARGAGAVSYYNDSFSTNPLTSMAAVDSFDKPTVLIAGGSDKGLDYSDWALKILTKASLEAVVLMGATAEKMRSAIEDAREKLGSGSDGGEATPTKVEVVKTLEEAVAEATRIAESELSGNDVVVVMSPAAASFDQFKDYKERGEMFKELVGG